MGCDTKVAGDYAIPVEANVDYLLSMWINVQELDGTPVNGIYPNITFDFAIDTNGVLVYGLIMILLKVNG